MIDEKEAHAASARRLLDLGRGFSECRPVLTALGSECRQLIFVELLGHYGGMRVGELVDLVNLSRPTVSHHLKVLREAGLVDMYEDGTANYYHVSSDVRIWRKIAALAADAELMASQWTAALRAGMGRPFRGAGRSEK